MPREFSKGQVVYDDRGRRGAYVAEVDDGHVVRFGVTAHDYDGEELAFFADPELVERVFPEPPTPVYEKRVAELRKMVAELEEEARSLNRTIEERKRENEELFRECAKIDEFKHLPRMIRGEMPTHVVVVEGSRIRVLSVEEAKDDSGSRAKVRMLSLQPDGNRARWFLNDWGDGSGRDSHALPAYSLEEAREAAREIARRHMAEMRPADARPCLIESAKELGVDVPAEVLAAAKESDLSYHKRMLRQAEERVSRYREILDQAEREWESYDAA